MNDKKIPFSQLLQVQLAFPLEKVSNIMNMLIEDYSRKDDDLSKFYVE